MATKDTLNSKIRGDTKNIMENDAAEIPVVVTVLRGSKKCALVKDHDSLQYKGGLQLRDELSKVKNEIGVLNKADSIGNNASTPSVKILKTTTAAKSVIVNTTIKKEISNEKESICKVLPAYTPTPVKLAKVIDVQTSGVNLNNTTGESQTSSDGYNKKCNNVIQLAAKNLSDEERRILRAKRFNIIVAESCQNATKDIAIKVSAPVYQSASSSGNHPTPTYDTLKKRAERFGENVSTVMKSLDNKEKMLKRKLKFLESVTNLKELEVKARRAERFRMI